MIVPLVFGVIRAKWSGQETAHAMFTAAAFVATSAGITARVLKDMGVLGCMESRVILDAAVIDDILAILLLGVVTALQRDTGANVGGLLLILLQAVGFVALIGLVGTHW